MVTICTEAIVNYIKKQCPIKPELAALEGGMSGDKKCNSQSMIQVRGKKVIAEIVIPKDVCYNILHATASEMHNNSLIGTRGLQLIGSIGFNAHFSNPITAMAIALGQDPACAAESHIGIARTELDENGDLYVAATVPNILVGTVGGGTKLPSQRVCFI